MMNEIGSGMIYLGLKKSNLTYVGIYASAHVHYALFLYACWPFSLVPVGLYDSLGPDAVRFIVKHADLRLVFADSIKRVQNLIANQDETSTLETIVTIAEPSAELISTAQEKRLRLITYNELIELGRANPVDCQPPKSADTAVVMYTSGSTGDPKGMIDDLGFSQTVSDTALFM